MHADIFKMNVYIIRCIKNRISWAHGLNAFSMNYLPAKLLNKQPCKIHKTVNSMEWIVTKLHGILACMHAYVHSIL